MHFEFVLNFRGNQDFALRQADSARPEDKSYSIYIPVKQFEADNKLIYRDFLTMLKADQYPYIIIKIPVAHLEKVLAGKVCTEHSIKITIDGVTNSYNVPGTAVNCREGRVYVTGLQNIKLTDFDISPPEKFFGMIRVKNEISVSFGFVFMV